MTWQDDAVWWAVFNRVMYVFEGGAIGFGRGAAADGSGEKGIAGDHDGRIESFDMEAECGNCVAGEIAGADGDLANADESDRKAVMVQRVAGDG